MQENFPLSISGLKGDVLENLLNHIPFGFSLMTGDYLVESVNDFWLQIVQKTREEVVGKNLFEVFPKQKNSYFLFLKISKQQANNFTLPNTASK